MQCDSFDILSPHCTVRYDARHQATHLYASCSEGCVVGRLRRYRLVMAELSFYRSPCV
jgi:hypothetical protein